MIWVEWQDQESFNLWHNALCLELGYPLTPVNQATGLLDENAQKTTAYTEAKEIQGKWIALVETQYADGLTLSDLRPPVKVFD